VDINSKKSILILGGNGLVGSSCFRILSDSNRYNVNKSTRKDTDLFDFQSTSKLINDLKPDILINAAAKVGGIYANNTQRVQFLIENLKINTNVLEASLPFSNIKIINLGSSCIYPLDAKNPIKESSFMEGKLEPTNSPYAMAKLTAIELGRSLSEQYGHQVINLMPTNLYGPNDFFSDMDSHVIPALIHRMHKAKHNNEKVFHIWGSGRPLREFLYVDDLSRCIEKIIELNVEEDLLNIGSSEEISIKNLALMIKEILEFKGELQFDSSKPDGNPRKLLDSSTINRYGWKPQIQLEEGIDLTYKWYCNNFK
jgi:GDP-L-fucose synthase